MKMPTWYMFPCPDSTYRWVMAGENPANEVEKQAPSKTPIKLDVCAPSRLPSMADLLSKGSSELLLQNNEHSSDGNPPSMFRTGSGSSVPVNQSSFAKAVSLLCENGASATHGGSSKLLLNNGHNEGSPPMFRTGSGKSVYVKQSSIQKAASVLGENDVTDKDGSSKLLKNNRHNNGSLPMFQTGSGKSVSIKQSLVDKAASLLGKNDCTDKDGSSKLLQNNGHNSGSLPIFQTGSGKSVSTNLSSASIIGENDGTDTRESPMLLQNNKDNSGNPPMFQIGLGKSVSVKQSSIMKALSVLGENDTARGDQVQGTEKVCSFSNSIFKTGSGKNVNISSAGVNKAKSLLGLDETPDNLCDWGSSRHLESRVDGHEGPDARAVPRHLLDCQTDLYLLGCESKEEAFQTAGGRSISVSNDALQRAKSLLGDLDIDSVENGGADGSLFSFHKKNSVHRTSLHREHESYVPSLQHDHAFSKYSPRNLLPPKVPHFTEKQGSATLEAFSSGSKFLNQVDGSSFAHMSHVLNSSNKAFSSPIMDLENSVEKGVGSRTIHQERPSVGPLVDISNHIGTTCKDQKLVTCEKRRLGRSSSISPFKKPRSSRFSAPLNNNISFLPSGSSTDKTPKDSVCKAKVFTRYPFQVARVTIKDFFGGPPCHQNELKHVADAVKCMKPDTAKTYVFSDASRSDGVGIDSFCDMLSQSGASMQYASREWVENHYKWIVWKLACYERGYSAKTSVKYLTVCNVLEELKYRYEREVNHGHRSALKRILEGDASPASMLVLCISAVLSKPDEKLNIENSIVPLDEANKFGGSSFSGAKIELTDGWYAVNAILDAALSKQLVAGKLFVGQKLRIWRAGLCGRVGPVSPLELSEAVSLKLHINGTYRTHWAERLGIWRGTVAPLAFSCIKSGGGLVPRTFAGVKRIYPILYRERLLGRGSIVRSEKMEDKMLQLYNQRRSTVAEGVRSEFQKEASSSNGRDENDSEEGAKILAILEKAAEPEVIMAEMSKEQLTSFAAYQAKQEAIRQSDVNRKIEKALEDAGLSERQVTPFMRVRVVGLTAKHARGKLTHSHREGLITLWNPTLDQQHKLVEGQAYVIDGLIPLNSDSETIYLQAGGSTTAWKPLPPLAMANLEPFFSPRKPVCLSNMGDVPLASEFDIAAVVIHVGESYLSGHQKKQWVFVTDGTVSESELEEENGSSDCLLAISFSSPVDDTSYAPVNDTPTGSTVGFFDLVRKSRDQVNNLWVADATDNSTYCFDIPGCSHLSEGAGSARKWAKISSLTIQKLRERVLFMVGNGDRC